MNHGPQTDKNSLTEMNQHWIMEPSAMNGLTIKGGCISQPTTTTTTTGAEIMIIWLQPRTELCLSSEGNLAKMIIETTPRENPTTN